MFHIGMMGMRYLHLGDLILETVNLRGVFLTAEVYLLTKFLSTSAAVPSICLTVACSFLRIVLHEAPLDRHGRARHTVSIISRIYRNTMRTEEPKPEYTSQSRGCSTPPIHYPFTNLVFEHKNKLMLVA